MPERFLYTIEEAADALRVSVRMVTNLRQRGQLRVTRIGRRVLISRAALEAFISRSEERRVSGRRKPSKA